MTLTFNHDTPDAPLPDSSTQPISMSENARSGDKPSVSNTSYSQRPGSPDRPPRPHRYPSVLARPWFILSSLAIALALVIVGMTTTVFSHPSVTAVRRTPTAVKALIPTPMPTRTPTPTPTPTSVPTPRPIATPTPTPLVLPTTQTYVLCNPTTLNSATAKLASFGGDVADNCGGQFFYSPLPTSMQEHYILHLSLPAVEAVDHCNISGFIPSIHATAQNMRADLFVNSVWLGWKGPINQNSGKGWQDMGLTYAIRATGSVTIDVQVIDQIDQAGELAWPTMKLACLMVAT